MKRLLQSKSSHGSSAALLHRISALHTTHSLQHQPSSSLSFHNMTHFSLQQSTNPLRSSSTTNKPKTTRAVKKSTTTTTTTSNTDVVVKNTRRAATAVVVADNDDEQHMSAPTTIIANNNSAQKSIEDIYQKKSPIQHVLDRPDTYVGSVDRFTRNAFILSSLSLSKPTRTKSTTTTSTATATASAQQSIINKSISYAPALYKIIDELLVNAVDNHNRSGTGTNELRVRFEMSNTDNKHNFWIHVWNNGKSIPVQIHKTEKIYVPELVFGHLLTGSNFDDSEVKFTGGRNGYGAKLANIFSRQFIVEIVDPLHHKHYKQVWSDNMSQCSEALVTPLVSSKTKGQSNSNSNGSIEISIQPDLSKFARFESQEQIEDFLALLRRRVYDLAACNPKLKVFLNDELVPVSNFQDYIKLFYRESEQVDATSDTVFAYKKINHNLELALGPSVGLHSSSSMKGHSHEMNEFVHFSFVNSIATSNGGTHISHLSSVIARKVWEHVKKHALFKEHEMNSTNSANNEAQFFRLILSQISLFANCLIENPSFDSQTKETLTTKSFQFMNKHFMVHSGAENEKKIDDLVKQFVQKTDILEDILSTALFRQQRKMRSKTRTSSQTAARLMIPKLDDANLAGGPHSHKCTLILTEGDSAKALAVAGLSVIGRDTFGVFPLKGKLLNVRDASIDQISNNAEIANLKKILGLENYIDSDNVNGDVRKGLRYGRVMLMCDQDHDGSHIKGLFINFLHYFYPNLLRSGFVEEFITPLIKASKQKNTLSFFSIAEYEQWRSKLIEESGTDEASKWSIKYYKGLGTSTGSEAKEYFSKLNEKHRIIFDFDEKKATDDNLIEMIFHRSNAQKRKEWLSNYRLLSENEGDQFVDHSKGRVSLTHFFNKEFVHFSQYDNVRSIPSLVDGLKPSQRKVLFAIMNKRKSNSNSEIKVAQLAGFVGEKTAYHHGEASLNSTIVNMAQDFVGSGNNIPLLFPSGQFGTRLQGGKDAASSRYIFTRLNSITRQIFPEADDPILEYNEEDGMQIEPKFFVPIIPMILVNGSEGVGTGWSTSVPTFHPLEIVQNLKNMINKKRCKDLKIWTRNFTGELQYDDEKKRYSSFGTIHLLPMKKNDKDYTISITELPLGKWTEDYKSYLVNQASGDDSMIKKFSEHHTDVNVRFDIVLKAEHFPNGSEEIIDSINQKLLHKLLKLESHVSLNNMTLFDEEGHIAQYSSVTDIMKQFYPTRLKYYEKRRQFMLDQYQSELKLFNNKLTFLKHFTSTNSGGKNNPLSTFASKKREDIIAYLKDELGLAPINDSFQYVLNLPVWNLTIENVEKLQKQVAEKQERYDELAAKTAEMLWLEDLNHLESTLVSLKENYVL